MLCQELPSSLHEVSQNQMNSVDHKHASFLDSSNQDMLSHLSVSTTDQAVTMATSTVSSNATINNSNSNQNDKNSNSHLGHTVKKQDSENLGIHGHYGEFCDLISNDLSLNNMNHDLYSVEGQSFGLDPQTIAFLGMETSQVSEDFLAKCIEQMQFEQNTVEELARNLNPSFSELLGYEPIPSSVYNDNKNDDVDNEDDNAEDENCSRKRAVCIAERNKLCESDLHAFRTTVLAPNDQNIFLSEGLSSLEIESYSSSATTFQQQRMFPQNSAQSPYQKSLHLSSMRLQPQQPSLKSHALTSGVSSSINTNEPYNHTEFNANVEASFITSTYGASEIDNHPIGLPPFNNQDSATSNRTVDPLFFKQGVTFSESDKIMSFSSPGMRTDISLESGALPPRIPLPHEVRVHSFFKITVLTILNCFVFLSCFNIILIVPFTIP